MTLDLGSSLDTDGIALVCIQWWCHPSMLLIPHSVQTVVTVSLFTLPRAAPNTLLLVFSGMPFVYVCE